MMTGPKALTAVELKAELEAERAGVPFLVLRDGEDAHRIVGLQDTIWIGRRDTADLCLRWDDQVSGVHAQLEPSGGEWTVVDGGLSRNGTFVNGERVSGKRRLQDGDVIRFGTTPVRYRAPAQALDRTVSAAGVVGVADLSETQRRVLQALCRPFRDGGSHAVPATNREIAAEVFLGVDAVKGHLRILFAKFGVEDLPQNRKRAALVERALRFGLVSRDEL